MVPWGYIQAMPTLAVCLQPVPSFGTYLGTMALELGLGRVVLLCLMFFGTSSNNVSRLGHRNSKVKTNPPTMPVSFLDLPSLLT